MGKQMIVVNITKKHNFEVTMTGSTYEVKSYLKRKGYKYSSGKWSKSRGSNFEVMSDLDGIRSRGIEMYVNCHGPMDMHTTWNFYCYQPEYVLDKMMATK
jgi:hypothetical protein